MPYTYANLKTPQNISSGIADYALLGAVSDFTDDGIKCPIAPFNNQGDEVKIKTAHQFNAGKAFAKFLLAPEKNELNAKTIGDLGFQKLDFELKIFIPGSYAEAHEAVKNIINTPLIVLVKDSNCPANNVGISWAVIASMPGQNLILQQALQSKATKDMMERSVTRMDISNCMLQAIRLVLAD